jgi:hypothetical protein
VRTAPDNGIEIELVSELFRLPDHKIVPPLFDSTMAVVPQLLTRISR